MKVESVEKGKALDAFVHKEALPVLQKMDGFLGLETFLCGGELDYKLLTKWETIEALKAVPESTDLKKVLCVPQDGVDVKSYGSQNFMHLSAQK
eukprot:CAMPEP_0197850304 /NCGR_PEP_ID=MMETSP1438-20131217/14964_1 /TAXON_ID=1461541 /ORGANISM="Pterosperma sp., Strain CCMP1384" /LENGTH=93 /DNA_ID=CAMNT_0043463403 /DNA_START=185 /DNA_END=466 /DNA_ORIENTATION=+